nr:MAG: polyprotein [Picornavirales sp.]
MFSAMSQASRYASSTKQNKTSMEFSDTLCFLKHVTTEFSNEFKRITTPKQSNHQNTTTKTDTPTEVAIQHFEIPFDNSIEENNSKIGEEEGMRDTTNEESIIPIIFEDSEVNEFELQTLSEEIWKEMELDMATNSLVKSPGRVSDEVLYKISSHKRRNFDPVIGFKRELTFTSRDNGPQILTTMEILMDSKITVTTNYQLTVLDCLFNTLARCNREQYSQTFGKVFGVKLEELPRYLINLGVKFEGLPKSIHIVKGKSFKKVSEKDISRMMGLVLKNAVKFTFGTEVFQETENHIYQLYSDEDTLQKSYGLLEEPEERQNINAPKAKSIIPEDTFVFESLEKFNIETIANSWAIEIDERNTYDQISLELEDEPLLIIQNEEEIKRNGPDIIEGVIIMDLEKNELPVCEALLKVSKKTAKFYLRKNYYFSWLEIQNIVQSIPLDERNIIYAIMASNFGSLSAFTEEIQKAGQSEKVIGIIEAYWNTYGKRQRGLDKLVYIVNSLKGEDTFELQSLVPQTLIPESVRVQFASAYEMVSKFATEGIFTYVSDTIKKLIDMCKTVLSYDLGTLLLVIFYASVIVLSEKLGPEMSVLLLSVVGDLLSLRIGSCLVKSTLKLVTSLYMMYRLRECNAFVKSIGFTLITLHLTECVVSGYHFAARSNLKKLINEILDWEFDNPNFDVLGNIRRFGEKNMIDMGELLQFETDEITKEETPKTENKLIEVLDSVHEEFKTSLLEKIIPSKLYDDFNMASLRRVGGFSRDFTATLAAGCKIHEYIGKVIQWIIKTVNMRVYGTVDLEEFLPGLKKEGELLAAEYHTFQKFKEVDTMPGIYTNDKLEEKKNYKFNTAVQLLNRVRNFRQKLLVLKKPPPSHVAGFYSNMEKQLNGYLVGNENSFTTIPSKIEPIVLWMQGRPGVGKTMCVDQLLRYVYTQMGESYDPAYDKYAKPESSDYWEGYHNQKVLLMDDFCQSKNVAYRHRMLAEFISLTTTASAPLNFAALENKGTSFFNSESVIITSNASFGGLQIGDLITSPSAMARRITAYVTVDNPIEGEDFDLEHSTFKVQKPRAPKDGEPEFEKVLTWTQFKRCILALFKMNRAINRSRIESYAMPIEKDEEAEDFEDTMDDVMKLIPSKFSKIHAERKKQRIQQRQERKIAQDIANGDLEDQNELVFETRTENIVNDNWFLSFLMAWLTMIFVSFFYFAKSLGDKIKETVSSISQYPIREVISKFFASIVKLGIGAILAIAIVLLALYLIISTTWNIIVSSLMGFTYMIKSVVSNFFGKEDDDEYDFEGRGRNKKWTTERRKNIRQYNATMAGVKGNGISGLPDSSSHMPNGHFDYNAAIISNDPSKIKFTCVICNKAAEVRLSDYKGETCSICSRRGKLSDMLAKVKETTETVCPTCGEIMEDNVTNEPCAICANKNEMYMEAGELSLCKSDPTFARILNRLRENMGIVRVESSEGKISVSYGLVTHGSCVLTVWHGFMNKKVVKITFECGRGIYTTGSNFTVEKVGHDAALFIIVSPKFRDIRGHFISRECDPNVFNERTIAMVNTESTNFGRGQTMKGFSTIMSGTPWKYDAAMKISVPSSVGDCGSPYVVWGKDMGEARILGVHSLGTGDKLSLPIAICEILCRENLKHRDYIDYIEETLELVLPMKTTVIDTSLPGCMLIGRLPLNCRGQFREESQIRPICSAQEVWAPKKAPAPCGSIEALKLGVNSAFDTDHSDVHPLYVKLAMENCLRNIERHPTKYSADRRILTIAEAIGGVMINGTLDPYVQPMKVSTSPGFIYRDIGPGKTALLYRDDVGMLTAYPEVLAIIEDKLNKMRNRIIPSTFWLDSLKDEKLPLVKVLAGKARVFSNGQFDMNVIVRMYFGQFIAHLCATHLVGECSVGISCTSEEETTAFYNFLSRRGRTTKYLAGDYSKYDKRLPFQMIKSFVDLVNAWYGDDNGEMREIIMFATFNGYRIAERDVYKQLHGMPSGTPLTAPANSVINGIMFRIVLMDLAMDHEVISHITEFPAIFDSLECRFYGDDNVVAVPDGMDWFNMMSVRDKMDEIFGMEYTTADKQVVNKPYFDISEISYLKRTFHIDNDVVQMRLDMDSIREMPMWSHGVFTPILAKSIVESMAIELSLYPRETYNEVLRPIVKAWQEYGVSDPGYRSSRIFVDFDYGLIFESGNKTKLSLKVRNNKSQELILPLVIYELPCTENKYEPSWNNAFVKENTRIQNLTKKIIVSDAVSITNFEFQTNETNQTVIPENTALQAGDATQLRTEHALTGFIENETYLANNDTTEVQNIRLAGPSAPSISEFISRPYKVWTSTLNNNNKGRLAVLFFPNTLFSRTTIWDKVKNYTYFRSGMSFKFIVNATKFHFGKILLRWVPLAYYGSISGVNTTMLPHDNIISRYPLKGIDVIINGSGTYEFSVPFVNVNQAIQLDSVREHTNANYSLGALEIWVQNKIGCVGTEDQSLTCSVFANFDKPELYGPTYKSYVKPDAMNYLNQFDDFAFANVAVTDEFEFQSGTEAEAKSKTKVLSSTLEKISKFASLFSAVPKYGVIAGAGSVIAGAGASVARFFGYGMPMSIQAPTDMMPANWDYQYTSGLRRGGYLSSTPEHALNPAYGYLGSEMEDTSIASIIQREAPIDKILILSDIAEDIIVSQYLINPATSYKTANTMSKNIVYHTPLSFVANMFQYWRGTMRYRFEFVASDFISMRFRVVWAPMQGTFPTTMPRDDIPNAISTVITVNGYTNYEVEVPYLNSTYMTRGAVGRIALYTESISAKSGAGSSFYLNVYCSALPDMKFSFLLPQQELMAQKVVAPTFEFQSKEYNIFDRQLIENPNPMTIDKGFDGEEYTSIKQIANRYCRVPIGVTSTNAMCIHPVANILHTGNRNTVKKSYLAIVCQLFRLRRGGLVIKNIKARNSSTTIAFETGAYINPNPDSSDYPFIEGRTINTTDLDNDLLSGYNAGSTSLDSCYEVALPMVARQLASYNEFTDKSSFQVDGMAFRTRNWVGPGTGYFAIAPTDDTSYHIFMGAPAVVV